MNINLRLKLLALGCIVTAVLFGWQVAQEDYIFPVLAAGLAVLGVLMTVVRASLGSIALSLVFLGYFVGNRGFAQIMPAPWLPLLPAEVALLVVGSWALVQCAFAHRVPFRRDSLNWIVLIWLIIGTARVLFDVRQFGLMAIRDYAMIYYAAFFFLAQHVVAEERPRRLLIRVLLLASITQPVAAILVELFPDFFLGTLVIRGVPLIYFKGDLALTFMAVSAFLLAFLARPTHRYWAWPLATLQMLYVLAGANRASMLGALAALVLLGFSRFRRFAVAQGLVLAGAFLVLSTVAVLIQNPVAQRKMHSITERVTSISDVFGAGTYDSEESFMKGDNNRFRTVWWRTVIEDVMHQNPAFGLGFGYDLARNFLREYYPDSVEDFTARSPHSIVISAVGRMGLVGLLVLGALFWVVAAKTWRVIRFESESPIIGLWVSVWVILVSACFGVVLEGPMGAVVFWSLLGMASAVSPTDPAAEAVVTDGDDLASLPQPKTEDFVAADEVTR